MSRSAPALVVEPRIRLRFGRKFEFGPGKAQLLELIEQTGSIAAAARQMKMSYMRAWTLVRSLDGSCEEPLVRAARGGSTRGGAELTATGREVLRLYREMEHTVEEAIRTTREKLLGQLAP